jgi:epoxyqueuosine reductase QueG
MPSPDSLEENRKILKELARQEGMSLFGVADLKPIRETFHPSLQDLASGLPYGISLGLCLSNAILDQLQGGPTLIYKHHYKAANYRLDQVALRFVHHIQERGYSALPIPASQMVDWEGQKGHLSHKLIGKFAGLGWIGRSSLLVNPQYGARVRYVTILTEMPLRSDIPLSHDCGKCRSCISLCPAGAISEDGYDMPRCVEKLKEFSSHHGIGVLICGMCVQACPLRGRTRAEE